MKKIWMLLALLSLIILTLVFYNPSDTGQIAYSTSTDDVATNVPQQDVLQTITIKKYGSKEIEDLVLIREQCVSKSRKLRSQNKNPRLRVLKALEQELKQGTSIRELLSYSGQYITYYVGYAGLLLKAQINIEKAKYDIAPSISILNEWKGLSVLEGYDASTIATLVDSYEDSSILRLSFSLDEDTKNIKLKLDALLNNGNKFTTYLESPFAGGSAISPAMLFVLTAKHLTIDEFKVAISGHSFTVNEVAVAINNNMPQEYLTALIDNTQNIRDMPIFVQDDGEFYYNLADLAVSVHNVELLKLLAGKGVTPTNEEGILTGMDIAIANLPYAEKHYQDLSQFPKKYINTLAYLHKKGYRAHVSRHSEIDAESIHFRAPNSKHFYSQSVKEPELQALLQRVEIIENSTHIQQVEENESILSNTLRAYRLEIGHLNSQEKACRTVKEDLLVAEHFYSWNMARAVIRRVMKNNNENTNIAALLHDIDPVLIYIWHSMTMHSNSMKAGYGKKSEFDELMSKDSTQNILDYSASLPLTQQETDYLFSSVLASPKKYVAIWNARTAPLQPSSLLKFSKLAMTKWQNLQEEGFDFAITDTWGNDLFFPAMLNSEEAVSFLLNEDLSPDFETTGLDILDLALENSYRHGKLDPKVFQALSLTQKIEASHYSRIARLQKFFPKEYKKLIDGNDLLIPAENTELNKYQFSSFF